MKIADVLQMKEQSRFKFINLSADKKLFVVIC